MRSETALAAIAVVFGVLCAIGSADRETCVLTRIPKQVSVFREDVNGKRCRGVVTVTACEGYCRTIEKGTHVFPNVEGDNTACLPTATNMVTKELTDCDDGALESAQNFEYTEITACGCQPLPRTVGQ